MNKQDFINAGFSVVGTENNENKLLKFLKEHYPSVIKDNEINLQELKAILGLPVDEKVNGYGLNFVGRNFARAKYAKKTDKELRFNPTLSKGVSAPLNAQSSSLSEDEGSLSEDEMNTQNLVIKGDNLDVLKILKNYYSGKIKCIYIDPPYNTDSDEFVYPDKFDKEELEVLGLANLSEDDFARMEFSFKTKKSHNGWLSFMYPRLLLARDLLSNDGVIFISIDDNEQANLKLLCDDVFGEENFVVNAIWEKVKIRKNSAKWFSDSHDHILIYCKNKQSATRNLLPRLDTSNYKNPDNDPRGPWIPIPIHANHKYNANYKIVKPNGVVLEKPKNNYWRLSEKKFNEYIKDNRIYWGEGSSYPMIKKFFFEVQEGLVPKSIFYFDEVGGNPNGDNELKKIFNGTKLFENPKPIGLLKAFLQISTNPFSNDIILDFFAGSGTTGQAVMELNAEDGGNRKFILVQIDEPIKEDKPAYKFCIENNLPPVISSITIERLRRAGEKIKKEIEEENTKNAGKLNFDTERSRSVDIGFKVFDTVEAPKLNVDDTGQILFPELNSDPLSRIYNMIFTVGLDEPTQVPKEVVKDCIYQVGNNYYITNSDKISKEDFAKVIDDSSKSGGKVFIDGWTASLNATLQHYKEDIKIVF